MSVHNLKCTASNTLVCCPLQIKMPFSFAPVRNGPGFRGPFQGVFFHELIYSVTPKSRQLYLQISVLEVHSQLEFRGFFNRPYLRRYFGLRHQPYLSNYYLVEPKEARDPSICHTTNTSLYSSLTGPSKTPFCSKWQFR